jgi:hypothetical protein
MIIWLELFVIICDYLILVIWWLFDDYLILIIRYYLMIIWSQLFVIIRWLFDPNYSWLFVIIWF